MKIHARNLFYWNASTLILTAAISLFAFGCNAENDGNSDEIAQKGAELSSEKSDPEELSSKQSEAGECPYASKGLGLRDGEGPHGAKGGCPHAGKGHHYGKDGCPYADNGLKDGKGPRCETGDCPRYAKGECPHAKALQGE
jgi:hypothetical protein